MELIIIFNFAYFVKSLEFDICIKRFFNCMCLCLGLSITQKICVLTRGYFLFVYLHSPSPHLRELLLYLCYTSFTLEVVPYKDLNKESLVRIHR